MGDPRAHLQFHEGVDVGHVSVRIGLEGCRVYHSFVEDEPIPFHELTDVDFFGVGVTSEEIRVGDIDIAAFVLRVLDLIEEIIAHDVIIELLTSPNIEREPTNFTALFPGVGDVAVILRAGRGELDDVFTF